ncbi:MAG TPA: hypothetical protein VFU94_11590, partial [Conexibacter sp.]|nr:hypothetical protein [Conexibacter sp.]
VELVTVRVSATTPAPAPPSALPADGGPQRGTTLAGPTVVPLPESTLVIPRGWTGTVREDGAIDVRRETKDAA